MEDFFNRIGKILENEGINITTLEQQIGASKGVLSRAKRNNTSISIEWVMNLVVKYQQYDANWLLTGRGDMLRKEGQQIVQTGEHNINHGHNIQGEGNSVEAVGKQLMEIIREKDKQIEALHKIIDKLSK